MKEIIAYLGLGTNLGKRRQNLVQASGCLNKSPGIKIIKQSRFYKTKPVGVVNQPDFLNAVVKIKTRLAPKELLKTVRAIERKMGRKRTYKWGPRLIDIDILFYSRSIIKRRHLTIPHPRLHKRRFVLEPLAEITPRTIHPMFKKTTYRLLKDLPD